MSKLAQLPPPKMLGPERGTEYFSAIQFNAEGTHLMAGLHSGQVHYYDVARLSKT